MERADRGSAFGGEGVRAGKGPEGVSPAVQVKHTFMSLFIKRQKKRFMIKIHCVYSKRSVS